MMDVRGAPEGQDLWGPFRTTDTETDPRAAMKRNRIVVYQPLGGYG